MLKKNLLILLLCLLIAFTFGCQAKDTGTEQNNQTTKTQETKQDTPQTPPPAEAPKANTNVDPSTVYQLQPPQKGDTIAIMKTSMGDIKIRLFPKEAPKAVENFIGLAKKGYYDNLIFHRVIKDFMIQGGDPQGTGIGGESLWGKDFKDEFSDKLHNLKGALSMANKGPNTNGSQFFIVQLDKSVMNQQMQDFMTQNSFKQEVIDQYMTFGGTPWLDNKHTVFGQVFEGMDVVDKIANVEVNPENSKPVADVKLVGIEITTVK